MTTIDVTPGSGARRAGQLWLRDHTLPLRVATALLVIGAAYHYSLLTLARSLGLDTPLAYLGLVPVMALGLALLRARPHASEPTIHDRQVDVIVGLPLIATAVLILTLLPARLSTLFWVWRIDLLSLPLFAAGVVALLFGVRAMWRLRLPLAFLLLAWPLPYTAFLSRWLDGFTSVTTGVLREALTYWRVAAAAPGGDGSLFSVTHGGSSFLLSVASSCSGVNGVVGFLLVGVAFTSVVQGRRWRKALWLALGIGLIWALNVVRLLLIFWAGQAYGERVTVDGLHPVIGLVLFCVGIAVMALTLPLFGLSVGGPPPAPTTAGPASGGRLAVPRVRIALAFLLATAALVGVADAGMSRYQFVAGDLGAARLAAFSTAPPTVAGFTSTNTATYPWAKRFFGNDSAWQRYAYTPLGAAGLPVTADVISTSSLGRFNDYGIEACYRFHGYEVRGQREFDLGGGIRGSLLTYTNAKARQSWDVLYWIWPTTGDKGRRYERVALLRSSSSTLAGPETRRDLVAGTRPTARGTLRAEGTLDQTGRDALVGFAKSLVRSRPGQA